MQAPQRSQLGGVRKPPGGGSSLSMKDLHGAAEDDEINKEQEALPNGSTHRVIEEVVKEPAVRGVRTDVGGQSSFSFGW